MKKLITGCVIALMSISTNSWGQYFSIDPIYYTIFDRDSLVGFDETAARASAISENFLGSEFKVQMYRLKRQYINNKYNLVPQEDYAKKFEDYLAASRPSPVPGCVNEDFEASTAAPITASTQIAGWTVNSGYNSNVSSTGTMSTWYPGGLTGATSCNLWGCCPMPPQNSALIDCSAPGGYVDPQIGSQYPIYSVFGSGSPNAAGGILNPQLGGGMFGNKVIRINDGVTGDYSMEKLSKTFLVTAQNALFQFAFISVFSPGHGCCDAGAFQIRLSSAPSAAGPFTVITCPNFSVSAPSSQCSATNSLIYLNAGTGTTYSPSVNFGLIYNKWNLNSLDLSIYLNQYINIDVITSDCTAGGHFGEVYFDAQCGPMVITGNGVPHDAGVATVTVPTCGAAGATICASPGLGPYSWAGPGITPNQAAPSLTNQCMTSTISATYTLFMGVGTCNPITRIVASTITPAPLLAASVQQAQCGGTLAIVSVTPSGSASLPSTLNWSPAPLSINSSTTIGSYQIPTGPLPNLVTITASDPLGCLVTATANVDPAPPYPTFTVVNLTGSSDITCTYPSIGLDAQTTYTYNNGSLNYFWASNSATFSASQVTVTTPGIYTINAVDPITNCGVSHTVAIGVNTIAPTSTVSPTTQMITCGVAAANVTIQTTQTVSVTHNVMSPLGGTVVANTPLVNYQPGGVGIFTTCLTSDINGCSTCKSFTIQSNTGFPTYSVVSAQNFTLGCGTKSVATINIINASATNSNQVPNGGPVSYTLIGPPTSTITPPGILSFLSTYTINTPGTWTVITKDNTNFCETRTPISILDNKFLPNVSAMVNTQILDCNTPRTTLKAQSLTNNVFYTWSFPGSPGTQPGDTITIYANSATPNSSLIANYTIMVVDSSSTCQNFSVVPMYQNMFVPKAIITNGGTSAISCKTASVMLTNQSTTSIPPATGFPTGLPVVGSLWKGPSPQPDVNNTSTYLALTVGTYTMYAKDLNNGCMSFTTITIDDARDYPIVNNPVPAGPSVLDCGANSTKVTPIITSPTAGLTYTWTAPPTASITNQFSLTLTTNEIGEYRITVRNPANGCETESSMSVINGSLVASFEPDQTSGYAPLAVTFVNTSKSTSNNSGITSIWNYGNGTTYSVGTATVSGNALYTQPGSYTVTLYASKGSCMESSRKVITVDVASKMEVPNIFTPNDDKINDYFRLTASNLTEITAVILDRWGHVVYEVTSTSGNIEWDGKNQKGAEVADGVYFYTITGKGKDGGDYNKSGTVTVAR